MEVIDVKRAVDYNYQKTQKGKNIMLETGIKLTRTTTVDHTRLASTMHSGTLDVFATPAMVAFMEETAMESVAPHLDQGTTTVGTKLEISHLAASPLGAHIRCESTLVEIDGRRLVFEIKAWDDADLIGEGRHERFIILSERFMAKVNAKKELLS